MSSDRFTILKTPLPDRDREPALLFAKMSGEDAISAPFRFELICHSSDPDIVANDLLGEPVSLSVLRAGTTDAYRYFHGLVDEFSFQDLSVSEGFYVYRLVLRPAVWFLGRQFDNRIFQHKSVPEIVEDVLGEAGVTDYRLDLTGSYPKREYCVQYGESNLAFVQRLLEHEGIFYYFEFEDGKHCMVIADASSDLAPVGDVSEITYEPDASVIHRNVGILTGMRRSDEVVTGAYAQTDYDFEAPSSDLMALSEMLKEHALDDAEQYSYPGTYIDHGRGKDLADIRLTARQVPAHNVHAVSTEALPMAGAMFKIVGATREAENDKFFVRAMTFEFVDANYSAGDSRTETSGFVAHYSLFPLSVPFHPPYVTPHPRMRGPQTAVVVGPAGEEIHTDQHARVKVQFHWDRLGGDDESSSCFVRVSAAWAGSGWGFIQIPRIGQEVIVDFLEGDPDQPIITGRVYNAEQMPPYDLPANATQSGWKSNSSPGGGGWNELRFEDKAGSEEVYFQAQKDHNELVKNNEARHIGNDFSEEVVNDATQWVGHDRTEMVDNNKSTTVGVDRTVSIGNNDTETVGVDRSLSVGSNETISVGSNSTETIGAHHTQTVGMNQAITVAVARVDTVGAAETRTVGAVQTNTIGASRSVTVGAGQDHTVGAGDSWTIGADQKVEIGAAQSVEIAADQSVKVGGSMAEAIAKDKSATIGENLSIEVGKTISIKAGDEITLVCGDAKFQMKKDGTIVIEGKDITIKASGNIVEKAGGDITQKGSKINMN
jgi:type VI secretion system secreted protein VgrG